MPYPRNPIFISLALTFAIAAGSASVAGTSPSPAFSLGWFSDACDDVSAQNPGDPAGCRYEARELNCDDGVDNDSDEATDVLDSDCSICRNEISSNAGQTGECASDAQSSFCHDGADNDGDGPVDCDDSDCQIDFDCASRCVGSFCECHPDDPSCQDVGDVCGDLACAGDESCENCPGDCGECEQKQEICGNGTDDDGNGLTDCADRTCSGNCDCTNSCGTDDTCDDSAACNYGEVGGCTYCECDGADNNNDGTTDEDDESCEPPPIDCIVISVSGVNADASFDAAVQAEIAKSKGRTAFVSMGGTENADGMGAALEATLKGYYGNKNQNERILVVAHSLGAIATFNMQQTYGGSYSDTTFLLYDAPYNYPGSANPTRWFSSTLRAIKRARDAGIAGALVADWTGGLDDPSDATEQANHEKFNSDSSALVGIKDWAGACPKER